MVERCHDVVLSTMSLAKRRNCTIGGIKGPSPLAKLTSLDLVWGLPPDYMHCVLEGVTQQITELWLTSTGKAFYIGNRIAELNERIKKVCPPISFTRLPRPLSERAFWKANEWKFWLLYYSVPCLDGILPPRYIRHFMLLSESVFMLLKETVEESETFIAQRLLQGFVQEVSVLYGAAAQTFNVHQLLHLAKSVRMTGPLWATSTFPFEGGNGEILKLVSAAKGVPRQITERIVMHGVMQSLKRLVTLPPYLKKQQAIISGKSTEQSQTCVLGAPLPLCVLEENVQALITEAVGAGVTVGEYFRARVRGIVLHSVKYTRAEKTCSSYFEDHSGNVFQVQGVFAAGAMILLLCQEVIREQYFLPFMYSIEHLPIKLTGAFGQQVTAELAYVPLIATEGNPYVMSEAVQSAVLCAITDKLLDGTDALITPNDYAQLLEERVKRDIVSDECSAVEETEAMVELSEEALEEQRAIVGVITAESNSEGSEPVKSKRQEFREAQEADPALRDAWAQAKAGTHDIFSTWGARDNLLRSGHQLYVKVDTGDVAKTGGNTEVFHN
ncbi:uncharacterized protein LOC125759999 [Rhipicephalus sanguineus]|uniref:uncharacterized protein LOC125759999 n=1 Tax=Rhipicephalus sanguineus TaxID=34632 RepID=UPI0020C4657A|nr:uncharacterized protein LOC125759999 [Rhipicephalus sanguineus]